MLDADVGCCGGNGRSSQLVWFWAQLQHSMVAWLDATLMSAKAWRCRTELQSVVHTCAFSADIDCYSAVHHVLGS